MQKVMIMIHTYDGDDDDIDELWRWWHWWRHWCIPPFQRQPLNRSWLTSSHHRLWPKIATHYDDGGIGEEEDGDDDANEVEIHWDIKHWKMVHFGCWRIVNKSIRGQSWSILWSRVELGSFCDFKSQGGHDDDPCPPRWWSMTIGDYVYDGEQDDDDGDVDEEKSRWQWWGSAPLPTLVVQIAIQKATNLNSEIHKSFCHFRAAPFREQKSRWGVGPTSQQDPSL